MTSVQSSCFGSSYYKVVAISLKPMDLSRVEGSGWGGGHIGRGVGGSGFTPRPLWTHWQSSVLFLCLRSEPRTEQGAKTQSVPDSAETPPTARPMQTHTLMGGWGVGGGAPLNLLSPVETQWAGSQTLLHVSDLRSVKVHINDKTSQSSEPGVGVQTKGGGGAVKRTNNYWELDTTKGRGLVMLEYKNTAKTHGSL